MWPNNCTPDDYAAWRREAVEEAAGLARSFSIEATERDTAMQVLHAVVAGLKKMLAQLRLRTTTPRGI